MANGYVMKQTPVLKIKNQSSIDQHIEACISSEIQWNLSKPNPQ